jgi:putative Mn2+ efflux pump MntP
MELAELLIIAVGVSMDAFAVSICKGLSVQNVRLKHAGLTALWFGGFQALMPLLGFFLGVSFADFVSNVDHWIAFILLGIIGGNMIKESFHKDEDRCVDPDFSFKTMLAMAVATSIDALAIGVSFAFLKVNIWYAVLFIGMTTAAFSGVGVYIGNIFGNRYKSKAEFAGGFILIVMGLKILLDHTVL